MSIILGLVLTLVLATISSIPVFIVLKFKDSYNNVCAWTLYLLCGLIYIILKVLCVENGISDDNDTAIPILALFILWFVSRIGYSKTKK